MSDERYFTLNDARELQQKSVLAFVRWMDETDQSWRTLPTARIMAWLDKQYPSVPSPVKEPDTLASIQRSADWAAERANALSVGYSSLDERIRALEEK